MRLTPLAARGVSRPGAPGARRRRRPRRRRPAPRRSRAGTRARGIVLAKTRARRRRARRRRRDVPPVRSAVVVRSAMGRRLARAARRRRRRACTGDARALLDGRADGAQFPAAPERHRDLTAKYVDAARRPHHRARHPQDDAGLARAREVRRALRRRHESSPAARRWHPDQGQPQAAGRRHRARRPRARRRAAGCRSKSKSRTLDELDEALAAGAPRILLDNFTPTTSAKRSSACNGRAEVEISGGVTLERIPEIAATGAEFVSVGALTHSVPAADLSFELEPA